MWRLFYATVLCRYSLQPSWSPSPSQLLSRFLASCSSSLAWQAPPGSCGGWCVCVTKNRRGSFVFPSGAQMFIQPEVLWCLTRLVSSSWAQQPVVRRFVAWGLYLFRHFPAETAAVELGERESLPLLRRSGSALNWSARREPCPSADVVGVLMFFYEGGQRWRC